MILIIDVNFFGQRLRNAHDLKFIEDPEGDKKKLQYECTNSLCTELNRIPGVQRIIIAKDYSSWRKHVQVLRPDGFEDQKYKENREGEKDYDDVKYYEAFGEWVGMLTEKLNLPVIQTYGAEADDVAAILAKGLSKNQKVLLWTSDGDYIQNLSDNVMLLKFPKRQLYMLKKPLESGNEYSGIFNMNENVNLHTLTESFAKDDIVFENPVVKVLVSSIYGDKKDNVSPVFFWNSASGNVMKPSDSYIKKALAKFELDYDTVSEDHLYTEEFMKNLIRELLIVTKQLAGGVDWKSKTTIAKTIDGALGSQAVVDQINKVYDIYKCNLNLKHLSPKQIPEDITRAIVEEYKKYSELGLKYDVKNIKNFENTLKVLGLGNIQNNTNFFSGFDLQVNSIIGMN